MNVLDFTVPVLFVSDHRSPVLLDVKVILMKGSGKPVSSFIVIARGASSHSMGRRVVFSRTL